jgi:hypothetical protein
MANGKSVNAMRPVKGVITGQKGSTLAIKLESGTTIHVPKTRGLNVGKPVLICYDFTRDQVKEILLEVKHQQALEYSIEEKKEEVIEKGETYDPDILDSGSGALQQIVEGCWEFWDDDAGSGVVVLSVPSFEGCDWHDPHS